jgi:hypothetical protein
MMLGTAIGALVGHTRRQQGRASLVIELAPSDGRVAPATDWPATCRSLPKTPSRTEGGTVYLVCRGALHPRRYRPDGETPAFERQLEEYLVEPLPVVAPARCGPIPTVRYHLCVQPATHCPTLAQGLRLRHSLVALCHHSRRRAPN